MIDLNRAAYISLATFRRTGAEVRTPVWFAAADDVYYVFSNGDAGKVKRLRQSPRARLAPCDVRGKILGEWCEARAQLLDEPAQIARAHAALRRKYGWQMATLDFFAGLSGRRRRRAYIALRLEAGA
jgi:PPOX class probable F420-dependent enzyme